MSPRSRVPGNARRRRRVIFVGCALAAGVLLTPTALGGLVAPDGSVSAAWFRPTATVLRLTAAVAGLAWALRRWGPTRLELGWLWACGLAAALGLGGQVALWQATPWERSGLPMGERVQRVNEANPRYVRPSPDLLGATLAERTERLGLAGALRERRRLAERLIQRGEPDALLFTERLLDNLEELGTPLVVTQRRELLRTYLAALLAGDGWESPENLYRARRLLLDHLESDAGDLGARWPLNLVCMERNEYPEKIPGEWRLDPGALTSEAPFPTFHDHAGRLGLDAPDLGGGALFEDFDGDGDLDLMTSSMEVDDPLTVRFTRVDGSLVDGAPTAGVDGVWGGANLLQADYDNDGDVDVFVPRGAWMGGHGRYPNSLLANDGEGRFEDVTEEAGLLTFRPTGTAAWGDFDNDGDLDLFVGNEELAGQDFPSALYRNRGDGTFRDVIKGSGLEPRGFVKGAVWGDYDNDGRMDLFVSCRRKGGRLYRNRPNARRGTVFRDVTEVAGLDPAHRGFACTFTDFDNDGLQDLFVGGFQGRADGEGVDPLADVLAAVSGTAMPRSLVPRLYHNRGDGTFVDLTRELGLDRVISVAGVNFADFDGDGWEDLYLGTGGPELLARQPDRLFRNEGGQRFVDVTASAGFGSLAKGQGSAVADFDGDGDLDLYGVQGGWYPVDRSSDVLLVNPGSGQRFLTLRLEGRESNRSALGARVTVRLRTAEGVREIPRVVTTGGSLGSHSLQLEIGLGDALAIEDVRVLWPRGQMQVLRGVPLDSVVRIHEGIPEWRLEAPVPLASD